MDYPEVLCPADCLFYLDKGPILKPIFINLRVDTLSGSWLGEESSLSNGEPAPSPDLSSQSCLPSLTADDLLLVGGRHQATQHRVEK